MEYYVYATKSMLSPHCTAGIVPNNGTIIKAIIISYGVGTKTKM